MPVDDAAFQAAMDAMLARVQAAAAGIANDAALVVEAAAKQRTPVQGGTLRRSYETEPGGSLGDVYARVGPTMVYARRVELGFHGADSLGRVYDQQPRPYLKPAIEQVRDPVMAMARRRVAAAIRG